MRAARRPPGARRKAFENVVEVAQPGSNPRRPRRRDKRSRSGCNSRFSVSLHGVRPRLANRSSADVSPPCQMVWASLVRLLVSSGSRRGLGSRNSPSSGSLARTLVCRAPAGGGAET
jgi:hypothetical protein